MLIFQGGWSIGQTLSKLLDGTSLFSKQTSETKKNIAQICCIKAGSCVSIPMSQNDKEEARTFRRQKKTRVFSLWANLG